MSDTTATQLHPDAVASLWRIFGGGASPYSDCDAYELVEGVIRKRVPAGPAADDAIMIIRGWFESHGDLRWLSSDHHDFVASAIVDGIGADRTDRALWALGALEPQHLLDRIRRQWTEEEIDAFVDAALRALENVCARDEVIDPRRAHETAGRNAKIPKASLMRTTPMETFAMLGRHGHDLVRFALRPVLVHLIELVIDLRPQRFRELIPRVDHPVLQLRATDRMVATFRRQDHRVTLAWITSAASDALIALAILETLTTVDCLDSDKQAHGKSWESTHFWCTELRPAVDDLDRAASQLLVDLVAALARLEPRASVRWIGELLAQAPYALRAHPDRSQMPPRVEDLERACLAELAALAARGWSGELTQVFGEARRTTPRSTETRHLAALAWKLRDAAPGAAANLARAVLDEYERHIEAELQRGHFYFQWDDWHHRRWTEGLGAALVLSSAAADPLTWIHEHARRLPLTAWDAEADPGRFMASDACIQHVFLVAFHAIALKAQLGTSTDPEHLRALAALYWAHCQLAERDATLSVTAEFIPRVLGKYGAVDLALILVCARDRGVGPRALLALIQECQGTIDPARAELTMAATETFGDPRPWGLDALYWWALIWLELHDAAAPEATAAAAEATALALQAGPALSRASELLLLRLAPIAPPDSKALSREVVRGLSRRLWPSRHHTPEPEREVRNATDDLLGAARMP